MLPRLPRSDASPAGERTILVRVGVSSDGVRPNADPTAWRVVIPRSEQPGPSTTADEIEPAVRVWRHRTTGAHRFRYRDGADFLLDAEALRVDVSQPPSLSVEDMCSYLLGPILAFVLRRHGTVCLHASAVRWGRGAVAFLGHAHAGKSTLAAAFALAGYDVITDDIVTLEATPDGRFEVAPDAPFLGLWPRSAELLFGDRQALPRFSDTWDKRYLDVRDHTSAVTRAEKLVAAYVLGPRIDDPDLGPSGLACRPLTGHRAVAALLGHLRAAELLEPAERPRELDVLSAVVRAVPVRALVRASTVRPQAVRDAVARDLAGLGLPPPPAHRGNAGSSAAGTS